MAKSSLHANKIKTVKATHKYSRARLKKRQKVALENIVKRLNNFDIEVIKAKRFKNLKFSEINTDKLNEYKEYLKRQKVMLETLTK